MGPKEDKFPQWPFIQQIQLNNIWERFLGLINCDKVGGQLFT